MELRHLRYFIAVAEELHFSRAAKRLNISQPPLSQQIRHLEEELGAGLLHRTKRRVQLTDVGRLFLEEARRTLTQAEQAVQTARRAGRGEIGQLAIGFVPAAGLSILPKILPVFVARLPDVHLVLHPMSGAAQVEALRDGRLNIGFLRPPVDDDTLAIESILTEPFVAVLPEAHPLSAYSRVPLRALARERHIVFPRRVAPQLFDLIVSFCRRAGFSLNVTQESDHIQTTLSLVAAGLGVSLIPASVRHLNMKGVVYRPLRSPVPHAKLGVAYRRDAESAVLRTFLSVVRGMAGENLKRGRLLRSPRFVPKHRGSQAHS